MPARAESRPRAPAAPARPAARPRLAGLERLFQALADATRLRILALLGGGEICVCHIYEALAVPQPTASRHLAYLRRSGLVEARRAGRWVYYRLAPAGDLVLGTILDTVGHCLGHLPVVDADRRRLARQTGCCPPAAGDVHGLPCCALKTGA